MTENGSAEITILAVTDCKVGNIYLTLNSEFFYNLSPTFKLKYSSYITKKENICEFEIAEKFRIPITF